MLTPTLQYLGEDSFAERRRRRLQAVTAALLDVPPAPLLAGPSTATLDSVRRPWLRARRPGADLRAELRRLATVRRPPGPSDPGCVGAAEACEAADCEPVDASSPHWLPGDDRLELLLLDREEADVSALLLPAPIVAPPSPPGCPVLLPPLGLRDLQDPLLDDDEKPLSDGEFVDLETAPAPPLAPSPAPLQPVDLPEPDLTLSELSELFEVTMLSQETDETSTEHGSAGQDSVEKSAGCKTVPSLPVSRTQRGCGATVSSKLHQACTKKNGPDAGSKLVVQQDSKPATASSDDFKAACVSATNPKPENRVCSTAADANPSEVPLQNLANPSEEVSVSRRQLEYPVSVKTQHNVVASNTDEVNKAKQEEAVDSVDRDEKCKSTCTMINENSEVCGNTKFLSDNGHAATIDNKQKVKHDNSDAISGSTTTANLKKPLPNSDIVMHSPERNETAGIGSFQTASMSPLGWSPEAKRQRVTSPTKSPQSRGLRILEDHSECAIPVVADRRRQAALVAEEALNGAEPDDVIPTGKSSVSRMANARGVVKETEGFEVVNLTGSRDDAICADGEIGVDRHCRMLFAECNNSVDESRSVPGSPDGQHNRSIFSPTAAGTSIFSPSCQLAWENIVLREQIPSPRKMPGSTPALNGTLTTSLHSTEANAPAVEVAKCDEIGRSCGILDSASAQVKTYDPVKISLDTSLRSTETCAHFEPVLLAKVKCQPNGGESTVQISNTAPLPSNSEPLVQKHPGSSVSASDDVCTHTVSRGLFLAKHETKGLAPLDSCKESDRLHTGIKSAPEQPCHPAALTTSHNLPSNGPSVAQQQQSAPTLPHNTMPLLPGTGEADQLKGSVSSSPIPQNPTLKSQSAAEQSCSHYQQPDDVQASAAPAPVTAWEAADSFIAALSSRVDERVRRGDVPSCRPLLQLLPARGRGRPSLLDRAVSSGGGGGRARQVALARSLLKLGELTEPSRALPMGRRTAQQTGGENPDGDTQPADAADPAKPMARDRIQGENTEKLSKGILTNRSIPIAHDYKGTAEHRIKDSHRNQHSALKQKTVPALPVSGSCDVKAYLDLPPPPQLVSAVKLDAAWHSDSSFPQSTSRFATEDHHNHTKLTTDDGEVVSNTAGGGDATERQSAAPRPAVPAVELLTSVRLNDATLRFLAVLVELGQRTLAASGADGAFTSQQPEQTRAELRRLLRRGEGTLPEPERRGLLSRYRRALAAHGLVRARQMAVHVSCAAACALLDKFRHMHADTLHGALDEACSALRSASESSRVTPHPRLWAAISELQRALHSHAALLVVTEAEAASEAEAVLQQQLPSAAVVFLRGDETVAQLRSALSTRPCVALCCTAAPPASWPLQQLFAAAVQLLCAPAEQLLSRCRRLRVPVINVSVQLDWGEVEGSPREAVLPAVLPAPTPTTSAAAVTIVASSEAAAFWELARLQRLTAGRIALRTRNYRELVGADSSHPDVAVSADTCLLLRPLRSLCAATAASRLVSQARALRERAARCWLLLVATANDGAGGGDADEARRQEAALSRLRALLAGVSRLPEYSVRLVRAEPDSWLHIAAEIVLSAHGADQAAAGGDRAAPPARCSADERRLLQLPCVNAVSAALLLRRCGPPDQLRRCQLSQLVQLLPELPVRVLAQLLRQLQLPAPAAQLSTPDGELPLTGEGGGSCPGAAAAPIVLSAETSCSALPSPLPGVADVPPPVPASSDGPGRYLPSPPPPPVPASSDGPGRYLPSPPPPPGVFDPHRPPSVEADVSSKHRRPAPAANFALQLRQPAAPGAQFSDIPPHSDRPQTHCDQQQPDAHQQQLNWCQQRATADPQTLRSSQMYFPESFPYSWAPVGGGFEPTSRTDAAGTDHTGPHLGGVEANALEWDCSRAAAPQSAGPCMEGAFSVRGAGVRPTERLQSRRHSLQGGDREIWMPGTGGEDMVDIQRVMRDAQLDAAAADLGLQDSPPMDASQL